MNYKTQIIFLLAMFHFVALAQQNFKLDTKKSKIFWKVETMGSHFGYILFSAGILAYTSNGQPLNGSATIDMKSMCSTDRPTPEAREKVDEQLRSADFFDVAHHVSSTILVQRIERTSNPSIFKISGNLTIRGITKLITFLSTIKKNGKEISLTAQFTIDRTQWNIHHKPESMDMFSSIKDKLIADDISISLNLFFN